MDPNTNLILEELEKFEKESTSSSKVPPVLEEYIKCVATNGDTIFPWSRIRHLIRHKLTTVVTEFFEHYCVASDLMDCSNPNIPQFDFIPTKDKILEHFDTFTGIPFTIQRLCEILIEPIRYYKTTDKFLRGLEKNILVVSYIEPGRPKRQPSPCIFNGLEGGGSFHMSHISSPTVGTLHRVRRVDDVEMQDLSDMGMKESMGETMNGEGQSSSTAMEDASSSSSSSTSPLSDDDDTDDHPNPKRQKLDTDEPSSPTHSLLQERLQLGSSVSCESSQSSDIKEDENSSNGVNNEEEVESQSDMEHDGVCNDQDQDEKIETKESEEDTVSSCEGAKATEVTTDKDSSSEDSNISEPIEKEEKDTSCDAEQPKDSIIECDESSKSTSTEDELMDNKDKEKDATFEKVEVSDGTCSTEVSESHSDATLTKDSTSETQSTVDNESTETNECVQEEAKEQVSDTSVDSTPTVEKVQEDKEETSESEATPVSNTEKEENIDGSESIESEPSTTKSDLEADSTSQNTSPKAETPTEENSPKVEVTSTPLHDESSKVEECTNSDSVSDCKSSDEVTSNEEKSDNCSSSNDTEAVINKD